VTDFGVLDAGVPFVVMELLRGEELSQRLKRERRLPLPVVVDVVTQLCRALTVAHEAGVVHRDLKPANVFLCTRDDEPATFVKLLDFGVAKADLEHEDTQGTRAGTIFGTPGYMSPEQISADAELDPRSDLWSVVVMTYRMVVGHTPFGAGSLRELGMRILTTEPPLPSSVCPDLPLGFDDWVRRGLSKERQERFSNATALAAALADALSGSPLAPRPAQPSLRPAADEAATFHAVSHSAAPPGARRGILRRALPVLGIGAGLLAAAALIWSFRSPTGPPTEEAHATTPVAIAPAVAVAPPERTVEPAPPAFRANEASEERAGAEPVLPPAELAQAPGEDSEALDAPEPKASPPTRRVRRAQSPAPVASTKPAIVKRATELWNKTDEL
jgi:serine/threonine-protein kinase